MRKILLLVVLLCSAGITNAQAIYFQTGKNFTNYDFKIDEGIGATLQAGIGNFYEIGYQIHLANEILDYNIGLNLNSYNGIGGDADFSFSWDTQYLGIQNMLSVVAIKNYGFESGLQGGLGLATMIYGKQNLDGQYLDLAGQKEFSGVVLSPKIGFFARYNVENDIVLSFGYAFSKSFNVTNSTPEKLSFNTQQIQFGVHFNYY